MRISVLENKDLLVFVGAYGSGKSEVAVNSALYMAAKNKHRDKADQAEIILADLDIINPFYRSADAKSFLEAEGIRLIASPYVNTNTETPYVTPELYSVFSDPEHGKKKVVLDIGGDDLGARVVGSLKKRISAWDHEILFVVNTGRPFTADLEQILKMKGELETAGGLKITGIINNTNLLDDSSTDFLLASQRVFDEFTDKTGIPLVFTSAVSDYCSEAAGLFAARGLPFLEMQRTVLYLE